MSILSAALSGGAPAPSTLEVALRTAELIAFDLTKAQAEIARFRDSDRALADRITDLQRQLETVRSERASLQLSLAKAEKAELPTAEVLELAGRRLKKQLRANERLMDLSRKWRNDAHKAFLCACMEEIAAELIEEPTPALNGEKK